MAGNLQANWVMLSVNPFLWHYRTEKSETRENGRSFLASGLGIVGFSRNLQISDIY